MTGNPLHGGSDAAVLQARIDELEGERERLRRRTHEIQEAADKRMGKLESQVAQYRNRFTTARDRVAPWIATWTTDPPSQERFGWWRYASQDQVDEITALVSEVRDAQAERDRYIRLFNRLEAAISHHRKAHESGRYFTDTPDEALWKAQGKILADACAGKG